MHCKKCKRKGDFREKIEGYGYFCRTCDVEIVEVAEGENSKGAYRDAVEWAGEQFAKAMKEKYIFVEKTLLKKATPSMALTINRLATTYVLMCGPHVPLLLKIPYVAYDALLLECGVSSFQATIQLETTVGTVTVKKRSPEDPGEWSWIE